MTTYAPLYAGITDLPEDYKTDGSTTGFSRRSAWWAVQPGRHAGRPSLGRHAVDVAEVRDPLQEKLFGTPGGDRRAGRAVAGN